MASYAVKKRTDGKKKHWRIILVYFDGEKRCRCERRIYVGDIGR